MSDAPTPKGCLVCSGKVLLAAAAIAFTWVFALDVPLFMAHWALTAVGLLVSAAIAGTLASRVVVRALYGIRGESHLCWQVLMSIGLQSLLGIVLVEVGGYWVEDGLWPVVYWAAGGLISNVLIVPAVVFLPCVRDFFTGQ